MVVRVKMLTTLGALVAGLGILTTPLPGWTQQPASGDIPRAERSGGQQDPFSAVEKMQQEIKRMQRDLERARADLDARMRDLQRRQQSFNDLVGQPKNRAATSSSSQLAGPIAQGLPPSPATTPPQVNGTPVPVRRGNASADFDRRLQDVERKLDMLIQLMRQNQRSGTRSGTTTAPSAVPGAENQPATPTPSLAPPGASPAIPEAPASPGLPARRSSDIAPPAPTARFIGF